MGYFSNYDIAQQEYREPTVPEWVESLRLRLDYLWDRLEDLLRWSEDPQFHDRYFYSDHIPEAHELPDTVQGALVAIEDANRQLREHNEQVRLYEFWIETVRRTGATPEGQMVLPRHVFPLHELQSQVA